MLTPSILLYLVIGILFLLWVTREDEERYEDYIGICIFVVLLWPWFLYLSITDKLQQYCLFETVLIDEDDY